jgi:CubicO group peptidase (beta-lactamase class C family)
MKVTSVIIPLCITLIICTQCSRSPYKNAIALSRDSIENFMRKQKIPGASVTVSVNGEIVWSEGFGFADLEQRVPVYPSKTKFRIGSISKSLTAVGLARLYEQQKIILDSSIYFYLPDYPKKLFRPTVRQLAGHLAGIRHYKDMSEFYNTAHFATVIDGLSMIRNDSLLFQPGTKFQYSTHGFNLLSAVMEKAAGENYLSFMEHEVFLPLKLNDTRADVNDSLIQDRTRFYEVKNNRWVNGPYVDNSYKWAGGGFISCSEDIAKFGNALLRDDYLKKETIELLTTPQKLIDGTATTYGMGFSRGNDDKGILQFGHSGGSVGGTTNMVIYPDKKIVVAVLTNLSQVDLMLISFHIAHLYMDDQNN